MSNRIIETIGVLTKKERLASVASETNCNKFVIESIKPFPGYHGLTVPDSLEPESLFVLTKLMYNDERIIRSIQAVKKITDLNFDTAPGTISLHNENYNFIRFKNLSYMQMGKILGYFEDAGIEFRRAKKVAPHETLIKVRKFFRMKETTKGVFQDILDKNQYYVQIPLMLRWNTFERITMDIKYNMEDKNFDAAQTSIYGEEGLMDFVRIFDKDCCQGKLLHIKEKYEDAISKL